MKSRAGVLAAVALAAAAAVGSAEAQLPPLDRQSATFAAPARIAFDAGGDVYTIAADGSDRRRLTMPGSFAREPAWAPDASKIAYVRRVETARKIRDEDDDGTAPQIWVMRADGGDQHAFAPLPPRGAFDSAPAWSPAGDRLALVRRGGEVESLIVTGEGGAGMRTLVNEDSEGDVEYSSPAWAPDGAAILCTRTRYGKGLPRQSLYVVPADGGPARRLATNAADGAWSPDGRRIAFTSLIDRNGSLCSECNPEPELYVMNADGSARTRLTSNKGADSAPAWSADGARIAFNSTRNFPKGEHPELYSIQPDGGCLTWLTNGTAEPRNPSWEPNAGLTTDPGGCDPSRRAPLFETDLTDAASTPIPDYWLGQETSGGLMASIVGAELGGADVFYDDCARFEPSACESPVLISNTPVCKEKRDLFRAGRVPSRLTRFSGALVFRLSGKEIFTQVYTGKVVVFIGGLGSRRPEPIVRALRPVEGESTPGELPLAQLPLNYWHRLERVSAARRRYGSSAAAARHLGLSKRAVKERLVVARRIAELGRFGRLRCP